MTDTKWLSEDEQRQNFLEAKRTGRKTGLDDGPPNSIVNVSDRRHTALAGEEMSRAYLEWKTSEEGQQTHRWDTLDLSPSQGGCFNNRLWYAFMAGVKAEREKNADYRDRMLEVARKADAEIAAQRERNRELVEALQEIRETITMGSREMRLHAKAALARNGGTK